MKQLSIISLIAFIAFSCQPEKAGIDKLKADRADLQNQVDQLKKEIAVLDAGIAALDTTKRYVLITTTPVETKSFAHYFEVQGSIEADKNVTIYPEIGGVVRKIYVAEGDRVKKGQVMVDLDTEIIELQIKELETNLELATTAYNRQQRLWNHKIGSEMQYLQAKNQKEILENSIATLKAQLRKNRIVAPFSGVVDEIWPKVGELTSQMTQMIRLVNLNQVYIKADVSEAYIDKIKKGTDVEVFFPAFNHTLKSKVDMIGSFINPMNRTFKIQVNLNNPNQNIKTNLMAYLRVKDFEVDSGLVIPNRLIQENPQGDKFVFIAENMSGITTVKKVGVQAEIAYKNETLVISGLHSNSVLVDKGARSIKDGQTVQVVNQ